MSDGEMVEGLSWTILDYSLYRQGKVYLSAGYQIRVPYQFLNQASAKFSSKYKQYAGTFPKTKNNMHRLYTSPSQVQPCLKVFLFSQLLSPCEPVVIITWFTIMIPTVFDLLFSDIITTLAKLLLVARRKEGNKDGYRKK
jgi:hypothetical protein